MANLDHDAAAQALEALIDAAVEKALRKMGIPNLCVAGVIKTISQVPAGSGKFYADVYLNGAATADTNIPVNPDIAAAITPGVPVWVMRVNFDKWDRFVAFRKLA